MTWLGVLALVILVLSCLAGYRRGFVREVIGISFLFLTIILVWIINPYVNQLLKKQTPVYEKVREACEEGVLNHMGSGEETGEKEEDVISGLPLPGFLKDGMLENNTAEIYQYFETDSFEGYLADYLATAVTNGISFTLSYILASIILRIVTYVLDLAANLPGIRVVNRAAGLILGSVKGLIFIWLGLLVITVFCGTDLGASLLRQAEGDPFVSFLYDKNIFVRIFMSIFYSR